ncbi:MAG: DUF1287 domain-containing protein [Candidatus Humimicrobiaceae bacterium]|jgi:uncharacterized protein YijF (DUF1287 family)|nr:DUF1287 domain-containing protein [Actinomycetota bacterium]MDD5601065.1 DUF1287 domain-containing protein [Actinomycetota bacterium]MDY0028193.1 DUF1287 domain-containing protein [Candidatus Humimicrobiaceae bacterium]
MEYRIRKKQLRRNHSYSYIVFTVIVIALLQMLSLKSFYYGRVIKLPDNLFKSSIDYPLSELTVDTAYKKPEPETMKTIGTYSSEENSSEESGESQSNGAENANLSDIQKNIVLKTLELLEEDIEYGYEVFPDTGYPQNNIWISTDVISVTLKECGYDLMELIYQDMIDHKKDYPMDIKGRETPIKYIDFRDVFFQEKFFSRNALTLPNEFDPESEDANLIWQPGDIVYFQFDEDNPYSDLAGFISPHTSDDGIPLVIMISSELGRISEVDVLMEYKIVGHYRYPQPEVD